MGIGSGPLLSSTALGRVLVYAFQKALHEFEVKEYSLTGRVLKRYDHPYIH